VDGQLWAWQSEGQGFESPRVHQIFEFRLVTYGVTTSDTNTLTDTLFDTLFDTLSGSADAKRVQNSGGTTSICEGPRRHQTESAALGGRSGARQDMAFYLMGLHRPE
jgi:hypothetical protein